MLKIFFVIIKVKRTFKKIQILAPGERAIFFFSKSRHFFYFEE
jgi:hypothetical protein